MTNDSHITSPGLPDAGEERAQTYVAGDAVSDSPAETVREDQTPAETADVDEEPASARVEPCPFVVAGDNIVVQEIEREQVTAGGVYLPESDKSKRDPEVVVVGRGPTAGFDIASSFLGPDRDEQPSRYQPEVGDVLVVHKHMMIGLELGEDGRQLKVLKADGIIGVLRKAAVLGG